MSLTNKVDQEREIGAEVTLPAGEPKKRRPYTIDRATQIQVELRDHPRYHDGLIEFEDLGYPFPEGCLYLLMGKE